MSLCKTVPVTSFEYVDALAETFHRRGGQPGMAYGVVVDGQLVHWGGLGTCKVGTERRPDADTRFRIASMTKSFTAAAVLLLRDQGALSLDDLAEDYVPEMRDWPLVTPDAARITVRHLLTMTAGFPTDDPWGDRQQGLPLEEFGKFLAGGVRFNWAPGTRFEYSNMGYAILGRIITAVSNLPYAEFVTAFLLRPLGMTRTGYEPSPDPNMAFGHRQGPTGWEELPFDPSGAFAPMGGLFTTVRDLFSWVAGLAAAFPPGTGGDGHPLRAASRRQMQQPQVPTAWGYPAAFPAGAASMCYGFGLSVADEPDFGRVVGHGGGYPGFGSYMRWHPVARTGVIAFGNGTYANLSSLTDVVLREVVKRGRDGSWASGASLAPGAAAWPETDAARAAVTRLLSSWDDAEADQLFSPNVALDTPFAERRAAIALLRERIGDFAVSDRAPEHDTPAHCRWWLSGDVQAGQDAQVEILLTPEPKPRVQLLRLAIPPAAGSPLRLALDALLAMMEGSGQAPATSGVDVPALERALTAARSWAGPCRLGAWTAGNGSTRCTVELAGEHAKLSLALAVDAATGELTEATVRR